MKPKLIEVTWIDAADLKGEPTWMSLEEIMEEADSREIIVKSVGYDLGLRNGQRILAGGWCSADEGPSHEVDQFSTIQLIPSRWIKSIRGVH